MASEYVLGETGLEKPYQPHSKQRAFHRSNKRFKIAAAGNRGGKTVAGAVEFLGNIYRDVAAGKGKAAVHIGNTFVPRLRYWVITPTSDMAQYSYDEIIRYCPRDLILKVNASTKEIRLRGDVVVEFKSTERGERLIAASLNGIWMDEASKCKPEAWRGGLRARIADQRGFALFTTTPYGGRNNWVYQDLVSRDGIDEHIAAFSWTTSDNSYFPREEFEHARDNMPPEWFARDWLASWDSFGGAIYPSFSDANICSEKEFRLEFRIPDYRRTQEFFSRVLGAFDPGFKSPGALLIVGEYGDGKWVVLDESYGPERHILSGSSVTWHGECERLMKKWGADELIMDPEDADGLDQLRKNGIHVRPARKNVYAGIRRVASVVHARNQNGRPHFRVFEGCKNTIREFRNYMWKPNKEQTGFLEEPLKENDHAMDALRYAGMELRLHEYLEEPRHTRSRPIG